MWAFGTHHAGDLMPTNYDTTGRRAERGQFSRGEVPTIRSGGLKVRRLP
jgi:hypothetical protein